MTKVNDDFKKDWANTISKNSQKLMEHYNYSSVLQLGNAIDAPESAISRWVKLSGEVGVQPAYYFGLIYEAFGMFGVEMLMTGKLPSKSDFQKTVMKLNLSQSLEAIRLLTDHIENLSKGAV